MPHRDEPPCLGNRQFQRRLGIDALCAGQRCLQTKCIEAIQLTDGIDPSKRPLRQVWVGVGQFQEVSPLVYPAVSQ